MANLGYHPKTLFLYPYTTCTRPTVYTLLYVGYIHRWGPGPSEGYAPGQVVGQLVMVATGATVDLYWLVV